MFSLCVLLLAGCTGEAGVSTLVATTNEPAGANCAAGGLRIDSGSDASGDGILNDDEIATTQFVCTGEDAVNSLVTTTNEPEGANCTTGGLRIDSGPDANGDGVLDENEITDTQYICGGETGLQSLVESTLVPADFDCPVGGVLIEYGIDDNGDGVLDIGEIDGDSLVCTGACQSAPFSVAKTFSSLTTETTPILDLDEVVITGAPNDVNVLNGNGLGVVGGASDTTVDGSESLTYEFGRPALDISYSNQSVNQGGGTAALGESTIEAFSADDISLGTVNVEESGPHDVSLLFGDIAISKFEVSANLDGHRVGSMTFTTCD